MKVKNLMDYPVQLGDGRMIGALGTKSDTRAYGKKELTDSDQKRVESGMLEVENLPVDAEETLNTPKSGTNLSDGAKAKNGGSK